MTVNAPEVPNGGAPDPRVAPVPQNPDVQVTVGEVFAAVEEFCAAHPDLPPYLVNSLKEAMVALEKRPRR